MLGPRGAGPSPGQPNSWCVAILWAMRRCECGNPEGRTETADSASVEGPNRAACLTERREERSRELPREVRREERRDET